MTGVRAPVTSSPHRSTAVVTSRVEGIRSFVQTSSHRLTVQSCGAARNRVDASEPVV